MLAMGRKTDVSLNSVHRLHVACMLLNGYKQSAGAVVTVEADYLKSVHWGLLIAGDLSSDDRRLMQ